LHFPARAWPNAKEKIKMVLTQRNNSMVSSKLRFSVVILRLGLTDESESREGSSSRWVRRVLILTRLKTTFGQRF